MRAITLWTLFPVVTCAVSALLLQRLGMHDLYRFFLVITVMYTVIYGLSSFSREKISVGHIFLLFGFFYAAFYSGHIIGPKYEAIW